MIRQLGLGLEDPSTAMQIYENEINASYVLGCIAKVKALERS